MDIRNKVAIVTGGGSGIGSALAERLATEGARGIVVADINLPAAEAVARAINGAGAERAMTLRCDVSVEADIQAQDYNRWLGGMQKVHAHQSGTLATEQRTSP